MKATRLERAIITLNARQLAAQDESYLAGLEPRALLVVTVVYLAVMLSVPLQAPGMIIWFAVYPIITAPAARIAYERVFRNSLYVLPFLVLLGIFNPLYDTAPSFGVGNIVISRGWVSFTSIVLRGLLAAQALLLLIYVCGFNRMCEAMRRLRMPSVLVTQLLMVYRYLSVLLAEALSMQRARSARAYGKTSYKASMWGSFAGQLLLRSIERSRRIDMAMKARGFDGSLVVSAESRWRTPDTVYCLVWACVFALLRCCDLSALMFNIVKI